MLVATCFLFILGLGLAHDQQRHVSNTEASTDHGHEGYGFLHAKIPEDLAEPEDYDSDENYLMWSLQRSVTFPLLSGFMKLLAELDGTSLKSIWNILNNMKSSRTFLDVLFYEFLPELTGEEFEFSPETSEELHHTEDRMSYDMVHKSGSLATLNEESNKQNSDQESVSDTEDWERIECDNEPDLVTGDDEIVSNLVDEPHDSHHNAKVIPIHIGSIIGIPGEDFPDYYDIPITSFGCADKKRIPGFYADLETGCQVFHVCWPHRRESFLCPIGTIFNQAILACDYWYSTNCSLAPLYYDNDPFAPGSEFPTASTESVIDDLLEKTKDEVSAKLHISATKSSTESIPKDDQSRPENEDLKTVLKFLPVKSKITHYLKPVETTTMLTSQPSVFKESIPKDKVKTRTKVDSQDVLLDKTLGIVDNVAKMAMKHLTKQQSKDAKHQIKDALKTKLRLQEPHRIPVSKPILKKPVVPVIHKERPLVKINPRFVVTPVSIKISHEKIKVVPLIKSSKLLKPKKSLKLHSLKGTKLLKEHVPEILTKSFKLANRVLHDGILPLTRKILMESYAKHLKEKH